MANTHENNTKSAIRERFINSIEYLLEGDSGLQKQDIAQKLGVSRTSMSEILNHRQHPPLEVILGLVTEFNVSSNYIFFGQKPIIMGNTRPVNPDNEADFILNEDVPPAQYGRYVPKNVPPTVPPAGKKGKKVPSIIHLGGANMGNIYNLGAPQVVTVNERGDENITYVPVKARAGYLTGYGDPEFMSHLPTYRIPGLTNGTYRMFEVEGPSMAPNIMHGDRVIGQWLSNLSEIRENRVHVIVTRDGVIVKRIQNRIEERGKIVIKSDTINHRKEYPTYQIDPEDILEIWYSRLKLSADFSEPAEVYHRLADLEADMVDVKRVIEHFTSQLPPPVQKNG